MKDGSFAAAEISGENGAFATNNLTLTWPDVDCSKKINWEGSGR